MFCADAPAVFDHLFEDEAVLELRPLIEDDVDVEVAVADVSVPEDESACLFSEMGQEVGPCSDIKGNVVGQDLPFLSDCGDGDILSDLPDLVVLLVVIGHEGVAVLRKRLEQLIEILCRGLDEQEVVIESDRVEDGRMELFGHCVVGVSIDVLQCGQSLS